MLPTPTEFQSVHLDGLGYRVIVGVLHQDKSRLLCGINASKCKRVSGNKWEVNIMKRGLLRGVYHFLVKWVFSNYVGFSRLIVATAETALG